MNRLISAAAALMLLAGCTTKPEPLPPPTPQQTRMEIALLRSNADLARSMLDSGVNPNGTTRNGVPYLISAAARQDLVLTEILLEHGADPNLKDAHGETALHAAAAISKPNILRMLLKRGASVNAPGHCGRTPLMEAARLGKLENVGLLLEHGADPALKDELGRNAVVYAALAPENGPELLKLLLSRRNDLMPAPLDLEHSPLLAAMRNGQPDTALYLLNQIPSYREKDFQPLGQAAMTIAIDRNKLDWVKLLTERGVDLHNSLSLAYKATEVLNMEGVYKFFARNGIIDRNYTPLMWAARRSRPEIAEYLVLQGSDVMAISNEEMNALDYANDVATRSAIRSAQSKLRALKAEKKTEEKKNN